jgi:hypothetical protein
LFGFRKLRSCGFVGYRSETDNARAACAIAGDQAKRAQNIHGNVFPTSMLRGGSFVPAIICETRRS